MNARGTPPAAYQVLNLLSYPWLGRRGRYPVLGYPHPGLRYPPPQKWTWDQSLGYPRKGHRTSGRTDKQTETITFPIIRMRAVKMVDGQLTSMNQQYLLLYELCISTYTYIYLYLMDYLSVVNPQWLSLVPAGDLSMTQSVSASGKNSCQNFVVHPKFSPDVSHSQGPLPSPLSIPPPNCIPSPPPPPLPFPSPSLTKGI